MRPPAIIVTELSKLYRLGLKEDLHDTFAGTISSWLTQPLRNLRYLRQLDTGSAQGETDPSLIWALNDVSLEIGEGERVGIIGANGAGKTTLLKILSRITEPTRGRVLVRGNVGSLLEVGIGFHPELTGRENVFLNGAILGMRRDEIGRRFDEIVAFAEVERFIDTPVKRFSSGMFVRLAFAVAAHLETDILLIDEVLAVGDAAFQRRCLGKMSQAASEGKTVLFVSHQLGLVRSLCDRAILIQDGRVAATGQTGSVIDRYLESCTDPSESGEKSYVDAPDKAFQLMRSRLLDPKGRPVTVFSSEDPVALELHVRVRRRVPGLYGYMTISTTDGTTVLESDSYDCPPNNIDTLPGGDHVIRVEIPPRTLAPGAYLIYLNFTSPSGEQGFQVDSPGTVHRFEVSDPFTRRGNQRRGFSGTLLEWQWLEDDAFPR
jgi:lipopolysaccharide transport system ATP-binding protein